MRGKVTGYFKMIWNNRITPAYAGKSLHYRSHRCNSRDHPRLCGEKLYPTIRRKILSGSPPPMRGKAMRYCASSMTIGITPAYAGKSCKASMQLSHHRDHPRLCGEKPGQFVDYVQCTRITPAYAGKSTLSPKCLRCPQDHPRLCGEKLL